LNLKDAKLLISTIPDYETNLLILNTYKKEKPDGIFICVAHKLEDAFDLYKQDSDYVLTPHLLGGEYASLLFEKHQFNKEDYKILKEKHLSHLKKRLELGHKL
jgi:Trk K+ transport system NAD-binding subunit